MRWDEMGWDGDGDGDGDEMGEARGLRMALLHCTALTPFFLSLDRPTSSSDPTQLSHTHNTPLPPSARFPDPGYTSVTTFLSRPLPDLVLSLLSSLQNTREISTLTQPLGKFSISDHRISICLSLHPSLIPSIRGRSLDRDPRSINFDQILYTHWLFSRPPLQFIPLLYLCIRNRHFHSIPSSRYLPLPLLVPT